MPENISAGMRERIKVDIIEQKMKVVVQIKAPQEVDEQFITYQDVLDALNKAGVKYGINEEKIKEYVDGQKWGEMFAAALGTPSGTGEDASLEYFFSTDQSLKPQITEDGHIDYKEVNTTNSVTKDSILIKKNPCTIGTPGINVNGNEIPGKAGKDVNLVMGPGTYKDPENGLLIKAATDGIVFFNSRNNTVEIQKLYVIQNSVDYSTGNVHVKSSVEIKGDVKPGFSVTTPYNIVVKGTVEQATISCDGSLTVKEGIVGEGKQLKAGDNKQLYKTGDNKQQLKTSDKKQIINVGGDINSGYINSQYVICKGNVYATTEIRSSIIECENEVIVVKPTGLIIGGKITASKKINSPTVGNLYNVSTELEVGVNFEFKEKYMHKMESKLGLQKQMEEFRNKIEVINSKPPDLGSNARMKTLKAQLQDAVDQMEKIKKDITEIEKDYYNIPNPVISVSKTVFPGTIIKIKNVILEVKEELTHVMFQLHDDKIEITKLK